LPSGLWTFCEDYLDIHRFTIPNNVENHAIAHAVAVFQQQVEITQ